MKETKMYEIQIETKDGWHNLLAFGNYEEIEELGGILSVDGLPDGTDLESEFDALKAFDGMHDRDQKIVLAYYEATDNFDPEEAMEAFAGRYLTPESFCEDICEEIDSEALEDLPSYLRGCIDWELVWSIYLRYDYFEQDGYYFRNL